MPASERVSIRVERVLFALSKTARLGRSGRVRDPSVFFIRFGVVVGAGDLVVVVDPDLLGSLPLRLEPIQLSVARHTSSSDVSRDGS
jgi:hypothetical protein